MTRPALYVLALAALAGCGGGSETRATADSAGRDVELAPVPGGNALNDRPSGSGGGSAPAAPARPAALTLAAGSTITARTTAEINSRANKAGETVHAKVGAAIKDRQGRVVIPAGATVTLTIAAIHESENKSDKTGTLKLTPVSVEIGGRSYDLHASVGALPTVLRGRKTNAGDVAKVGAGAGIGAVAGRVIGGSTKGAVIGGVIGGAVGTQRAIETKDRDVVLPAHATITLTLRGPLTVER